MADGLAWEVVVWIADDLAAWLVEQLADAGRRRLADFVFGDEFERAMGKAATAAVQATADELSPGDADRAEHLAMIINEWFGTPVPDLSADQTTVLETLRTGIARQVAILEDRELTETGLSSVEVAGFEPGVLAPVLTRHLLTRIVNEGARGGPLFPLAAQLNADVGRLQAEQTQDMIRQLGTGLMAAIARLGRPGGAATDSAAAASADKRDRSLSRLRAADLRQSMEDRTREPDLWHRYQAARMIPRIQTTPGEPTRYFVTVKNTGDLPVYNVFPAMHFKLSNSRGTHTFPEYLEQALMPGDTVRFPAKGNFIWEVPPGSEEIWVQIWFRDAQLIYWTKTSKGEIVEQNGPPMILGPRGQLPADLQPGHQPRGWRS